MSADLNDPAFWDGCSDYQKLAHAFTSPYAEHAWERAALPAGATVLDIAAGAGALALVAVRGCSRPTSPPAWSGACCPTASRTWRRG